MTPILKTLPWSPIEARINFKILLIVYKTLNGHSADYLEPTIKEYYPSRTLRSSSRFLLCIPPHKSKIYGGRSFSNAAPQLWNSIPQGIKESETKETFKSRLKTFMFEKHVSD